LKKNIFWKKVQNGTGVSPEHFAGNKRVQKHWTFTHFQRIGTPLAAFFLLRKFQKQKPIGFLTELWHLRH